MDDDVSLSGTSTTLSSGHHMRNARCRGSSSSSDDGDFGIPCNNSTKIVGLGFRTVKQGERALIWNQQGRCRQVDGPARVTLWQATFEKLVLYQAGQNEYLELQQVDGERKVLPGPCSLFKNPVEHTSLIRRTAEFINAGEAIVIYRNRKTNDSGASSTNVSLTNGVERIIKRGPFRYIPEPDEWLHQFTWHGSKGNKTKKIYGALQFTKLRTIADQTYYNVHEVRTKDDTLLTVKLMIFFELLDIEKMLDNTHDPIGDFINAAASDVVAFCASLTYEEFIEQTSSLNQKTSYSQLVSRAEAIGYQINKVVFRGFHTSNALQAMHDKAIKERTRLRLENDTEEQRQRLLDCQLEKKEERSVRQRQLDTARLAHKRQMSQHQHLQSLQQDKEWQEQLAAEEDQLARAEERRMAKMKELGVDLTKVLVAEQRAAGNGSQVRIEGIKGVSWAEDRRRGPKAMLPQLNAPSERFQGNGSSSSSSSCSSDDANPSPRPYVPPPLVHRPDLRPLQRPGSSSSASSSSTSPKPQAHLPGFNFTQV